MSEERDKVIDIFTASDLPKAYKELRSFINYIDLGFFGILIFILFIIWNTIINGNWTNIISPMIILIINFVGLGVFHFQLVNQRKDSIFTYIIISIINVLIWIVPSIVNNSFTFNLFSIISFIIPILFIIQIYYFIRKGVLR
jgi:hypothetical protein